MTPDKILVTLGGMVTIALIVWFFWLVKKSGVKASLESSGYQEIMVLVKGGYTPDVIVVAPSQLLINGKAVGATSLILISSSL